MMGELISIIIPVYNSEKYLKKCLQSLLDQSYPYFEIIIVNDGSTDSSKKICEELSEKDSRIRVINQENSGVSVARNRGMSEMKGKYFTFVDADDYVNKDFLKILFESIIQNDSDMSVCGLIHENDDNTKIASSNYQDEILDTDKALISLLKNYCDNGIDGFVWNKLFKTELLGEIKFDTDIYQSEDTLFLCQYLLKCKMISIHKSIQYHYVKNSTSCMATIGVGKKYYSKLLSIIRMENLIKDNENLEVKNAYFVRKCRFLVDFSINNAIYDKDNYLRKAQKQVRAAKKISIIRCKDINYKQKIYLLLLNMSVIIFKLCVKMNYKR